MSAIDSAHGPPINILVFFLICIPMLSFYLYPHVPLIYISIFCLIYIPIFPLSISHLPPYLYPHAFMVQAAPRCLSEPTPAWSICEL